MKKYLSLIIAAVFALSPAFGQSGGRVVLKKVLTLEPTSYEGGNGAGVVWHAALKRFYTARAGNVDYPLDYFSATGKKLSSDTLRTMFDMRGMWYNTMTKRICMNGYNDFGWASYKMNAAGIPVELTTIATGMNQPNEQSSGCFDGLKSRVYFLAGTSIFAYNANNGEKIQETEILNLREGINKAHSLNLIEGDELPDFYNAALVFTGIPDQEFGLLNSQDKQIDLFSAKTGMRTKVYSLPEGTETQTTFNFAYANKIFFVYSKEDHKWYGFK